MKATIEFDITLDDKETAKERIEAVLRGLGDKIFNQIERESGCICTHPERDDILKDMTGNTVGSVTVQRDDDYDYKS